MRHYIPILLAATFGDWLQAQLRVRFTVRPGTYAGIQTCMFFPIILFYNKFCSKKEGLLCLPPQYNPNAPNIWPPSEQIKCPELDFDDCKAEVLRDVCPPTTCPPPPPQVPLICPPPPPPIPYICPPTTFPPPPPQVPLICPPPPPAIPHICPQATCPPPPPPVPLIYPQATCPPPQPINCPPAICSPPPPLVCPRTICPPPQTDYMPSVASTASSNNMSSTNNMPHTSIT